MPYDTAAFLKSLFAQSGSERRASRTEDRARDPGPADAIACPVAPVRERSPIAESGEVVGELPDLSKILPPADWLTPQQRRLWRERTAAYVAEGMPKLEAEQEAMAELVWTGRLANSTRAFAWPG